MAQFFSDAFTGTTGAPWDSTKWTTSGISTEFDVDIQSNRGRMSVDGGVTQWTQAARALGDLTDSAHTDIDLLVEGVRFTGDPTAKFWMCWLRASGDWDGFGTRLGFGPDTGYRLSVNGDNGNIALVVVHADGTEASLVSAAGAMPVASGQIWNVRFRIEGTSLKARVWEPGSESEPTIWDLEATNSAYPSGVIQLSLSQLNSTATAGGPEIDALTADDMAAGGSFTGSAAVTQGADTASASGVYTPPPITGTAAPAQAGDTSSATGTYTPPPISGSAAVVQADDTSSGSGTFTAPTFTGTSGASQGADTASASGTFTSPSVTGTAAVTQGADVATATGAYVPPPIVGSAAAVQGADTSTGTGTSGGIPSTARYREAVVSASTRTATVADTSRQATVHAGIREATVR